MDRQILIYLSDKVNQVMANWNFANLKGMQQLHLGYMNLKLKHVQTWPVPFVPGGASWPVPFVLRGVKVVW